MELSTAKQAPPEKYTVRIWYLSESVIWTIGPLTAQNRNNEEPLSVHRRSRGWEHSAPGHGQTTAHDGTHELTSPQSERRCFRTFLHSRVGSLVDAAALARHQGPVRGGYSSPRVTRGRHEPGKHGAKHHVHPRRGENKRDQPSVERYSLA